MTLLEKLSNVTINTNADGKQVNCTVLKYDGSSRKYSWSSTVNNTFAYQDKEDYFIIYKLMGNHKFSITDKLPKEVLNEIING